MTKSEPNKANNIHVQFNVNENHGQVTGINVSLGRQRRIISQEAGDRFIEVSRNYVAEPFEIIALATDIDSVQLMDLLIGVLTSAGWELRRRAERNGINAVPNGVTVEWKSPTASTENVMKWLTELKLKPVGREKSSVEGVTFLIGPAQ